MRIWIPVVGLGRRLERALGLIGIVVTASIIAGDSTTISVRAAGGPPFDDPQQLVAAYYQTFQAGVNGGDFGALLPFFQPDGAIDSPLVPGGGAGSAGIARFYQKLPPMSEFTVETSNLSVDPPYVDVDWRFRAAPKSLRGYLDGHDTFKLRDGLIAALTQTANDDDIAAAFLPPPSAPAPPGNGVPGMSVSIQGFAYSPSVIRIPVGATVTWTNDDSDLHTATTDDLALDSGVIDQGVSASLKFAVAGDFAYYCTIHPGMRGRVIVGS